MDKQILYISTLFFSAIISAQNGTLKVETTGSIKVFTTASLTVNEKITNLGDGNNFILKTDANLIQISNVENTGYITAERAITELKNSAAAVDYVYWGSPVLGQQTIGSGGFSPGTPSNRFYSYSESNDRFYATGDPTFTPGKGYAVRAEDGLGSPYDKKYIFKGTPNNGDINFSIIKSPDNPVGTVHGYNLIGNPYPSNINFSELYAGNNQGGNNPLIYNTAYFWTNATYQQYQQGSGYGGNNYAVWNATGGSNGTSPAGTPKPNGIIKVGQGFIVQKINEGSAPLIFKNAYGVKKLRVTDPASFYQKGGAEKNRFWLNLIAPSQLVNSQLIGYIEGGSNGYEQDYDAEAFGNFSDLFYSVLPNKKLVIQGKNVNFSEDDKVTLGANFFQTGSYTIALDQPEGIFVSTQDIYLKDNLKRTVTNLSEGSYQFQSSAGDTATRFEIIYKPESFLATDEETNSSIQVYRKANIFIINSPIDKILELELYDTSGKLLLKKKPNATDLEIDGSTLVQGVYLIKIKTKNSVLTKRIIK